MIKRKASHFENTNPTGRAVHIEVTDGSDSPTVTSKEQRISLAPLDPKDVLRAMLSTPPADDQD